MNFPRNQKLAFISLFLLLATACESSLQVKTEAEVPTPLVSQLPVNMGIVYDAAFRAYAHTEDSEERPNWSIEHGAAQVTFFDQITSSMFRQTVSLDSLESPPGQTLDAFLVPAVEEMQFALPQETRTDFYEAWLKYRLKLYDADKTPITELLVTGYGKSSTAFFKSREEGLKIAINNAFRDIGAKLTIHFPGNSAVQQWLSRRQTACNTHGNVC